MIVACEPHDPIAALIGERSGEPIDVVERRLIGARANELDASAEAGHGAVVDRIVGGTVGGWLPGGDGREDGG